MWRFTGLSLSVSVCRRLSLRCRSNGAKGVITLKRSDLSPAPAINTPGEETQWISSADTLREEGGGDNEERFGQVNP